MILFDLICTDEIINDQLLTIAQIIKIVNQTDVNKQKQDFSSLVRFPPIQASLNCARTRIGFIPMGSFTDAEG
jgi:hypothetical protein